MSVLRHLRVWRQRWQSVAHKDALDRELRRELAFHFEQLVAEKVGEGLSLPEARREAHRTFGNVASLEELCRDERRVAWLHDLRQDVMYGLRMLRKQPGLAFVAIMSLALGIGANTAVLGAYDALFVRGLPVANADRLVAIQSMPLDNPARVGGLSLPEFAAIRDRSQSFDVVDASIKWSTDLAADVPGTPADRVVGQLVTPSWLSLLGIAPTRGQVFTASSLQSDPVNQVIVISHGFWQRRFGGNPDVLKQHVRLQGSVRTIIGVMPADFRYHDPGVDYWAPLIVAKTPDQGGRLFGVRGRLKPGVTIEQAQAELRDLAAKLATERPGQNQGRGLQVRSLNEVLFGWTREPLMVFEAAVAFVLLIAAANVASLLLSRGTTRRQEMALRAALGAGRGRLIRQLLAESMLLAIGGGLVGVGVALAGQQVIIGMVGPPAAPDLTPVGFNWRVLGLLALLSIGSGIACGLAPAIRNTALDPIRSLNGPGPVFGFRQRPSFARGALVSLQLAIALILLIGSGLLLNSFVRMVGRDLNLDPDGLVRLDYQVPAADYTRRIGNHDGFPYFEITQPPSRRLQEVLERLRTVSGAESVAGISSPPVDSFVLTIPEVQLDTPGAARTSATYFIATPHLFHTLRTPIVQGRDFSDDDSVGTPWVAIVNETCARLFWPGENPIGRHFTFDIVPDELPREVIGVVRDIPTRHAEPPQPVIYASYRQQPAHYRAPWANFLGGMTFLIRAPDAPALIPSVRQAIAGIDPERSLANVGTVESHMRSATARFRFYVLLVAVLAGVATLLAAIGTYGVMSYAVSQHTREIGIRRALGAGPGGIIRFVGRRGLVLVGVGLAAGLAGAFILTRLIASQLWGITATDPVTFAGVSLLLIAVAAVACVIPARRALAVNPTVALRTE